MTERETCPKCGTLFSHHFENGDNFGVAWHCGSTDSLNGFVQSTQCAMTEREPARTVGEETGSKGEPMIYLASPYSDKSLLTETVRYIAACKAAAELMSRGELVFSPIAHSHGIALCGDLGGSWEHWQEFDREMIFWCSELVVLKLSGWEKSEGIAAEIEIAREFGRPVRYMKPSEFECFGGKTDGTNARR